MDTVLKTILDYATKVHAGQTRKYTPDPYISHPIRVMETCRQYTHNTAVCAAALLHDVLEDTPVTERDLLGFLHAVMPRDIAEETLGYVVELTDVYTKRGYPQYNRRTRKGMELKRLTRISPNAQTIKYADIIDNASEIVMHDPDFSEVLLGEYRQLLEHLVRGNSKLHARAIKAVGGG
ncbi:HD domain-containing protein [Parapedobacter composti]|nr:HD domain-containing protein [Parapedobacter composti]